MVRRQAILAFIALLLMAFVAPGVAWAQDATEQETAERLIRVGLGRSQTSATVSAEGAFAVVVADETILSAEPGQLVVLQLVSGGVQVDDLPTVHTEPVRIVPAPVPIGETNRVRYKQLRYRGELEVLVNDRDGRLSVVNVIDLEEYLLGVVGKEMPPTWAPEALKAQAIACRTFAVYHLQGGKYPTEGFDVTDDTDSQVYSGVAGEHPNSNMAVGVTKGKVVTYEGQLIGAYYHSSSGGYTENSENVWGPTAVPYLRAVPDFDHHPDNGRYEWTVQRTLAQVAQGMRAQLGIDPGALLDLQPGTTSSSGRPASFAAIGTRGTFTLRPENLRWVLGSHSHVKEIVRAATTTPLQIFGMGASGQTVAAPLDLSIQGAAGTATRSLTGATVIGAAGVPVALQTEKVVQNTDGPLTFRGGGWGHRVGMSQWGARGMADMGKTYTEILTHYYTGTKVETQ